MRCYIGIERIALKQYILANTICISGCPCTAFDFRYIFFFLFLVLILQRSVIKCYIIKYMPKNQCSFLSSFSCKFKYEMNERKKSLVKIEITDNFHSSRFHNTEHRKLCMFNGLNLIKQQNPSIDFIKFNHLRQEKKK